MTPSAPASANFSMASDGTGVPGDTTIRNGFKSLGGQFGTHPVDGVGPGGGAQVHDDRLRPDPTAGRRTPPPR
ncbi:hypothetical protein [Streptomyces coeruleorubidus]